jgi:anti-anti-sigma factor
MGASAAKLLVAVEGPRAIIRACGRASFTCSADFKRLVYDLFDRGCREFVLELSECSIMDSTFLGILVRFAGKLDESGGAAHRMTLWNPSARILELLGSLGMEEFFRVQQGQQPLAAKCDEVAASPSDKTENTRVALDAHQALMAANTANVNRFKDVARFLAEDLKRLEK